MQKKLIVNSDRAKLLESKGIKITAVRELVAGVFLEKKHALSLFDIENSLPWSDRVTLFRTIKTFEQQGLVHQINDGSSSLKYALCEEECKIKKHFDIHPHFHCDNCNKTICLDPQEIKTTTIPENFIVKDYSLVFNGICDECIQLTIED